MSLVMTEGKMLYFLICGSHSLSPFSLLFMYQENLRVSFTCKGCAPGKYLILELSLLSNIPLLNRAAVGWVVSCSAFGLFLFIYFFSFVGEQTQTPSRPIVITR